MAKKSIEITVGLFLLAGIAALIVLALKVGNLGAAGYSDSFRVSAQFDNIGGLNVKAPVTMAGVKIGRVAEINVDKDDYRAVVQLDLDARYDNLPKDTSASILTSGLLGAQYIGLEPGGEDSFLTEGDKIELTQSAIALEQLIGRMLFKTAEGGGQ